jgi:hypothetical protein
MTDTPQVLLAHHLKALKLPTMLREYDKIARQCAAESLDYPRYLLRLVEVDLPGFSGEPFASAVSSPGASPRRLPG